MERLGLDIAKTLARELGCEVRSYSRHGRYGGIVIVSGIVIVITIVIVMAIAIDIVNAVLMILATAI